MRRFRLIPASTACRSTTTTRSNIKTPTGVIGIAENVNKNYGIVVYPNPASDYIVVFSPDDISNVEITISDMLGNEIAKEIVSSLSNFKYNLSHFSSGVYLVKIKKGDEIIYVNKVIKSE